MADASVAMKPFATCRFALGGGSRKAGRERRCSAAIRGWRSRPLGQLARSTRPSPSRQSSAGCGPRRQDGSVSEFFKPPPVPPRPPRAERLPFQRPFGFVGAAAPISFVLTRQDEVAVAVSEVIVYPN